MKKFASDVFIAARTGRLTEPFDAVMVKKACPGWAEHTYHTFLGKHALGSGATTEHFVRVDLGQYRLLRPK
ncbi:MAG: hypothetical protein ABSA48_00195 [Terracidiphilus sp.]|jgi:hypothetical protein